MNDAVPTLKTDRLILRPFAISDASRIHELLQAPEIARTTLNIPYPYPEGAATQWISTHAASATSGAGLTWAVCLSPEPEPIGAVSLMINTLHQNANVAYWLGVDYWNRGITSEAVHVVMDYGFRQLRLHRIGAGCFPENMGSVKVIQKNGMRREGTRRESCLKDGTFRDITWFATLRREWEQR